MPRPASDHSARPRSSSLRPLSKRFALSLCGAPHGPRRGSIRCESLAREIIKKQVPRLSRWMQPPVGCRRLIINLSILHRAAPARRPTGPLAPAGPCTCIPACAPIYIYICLSAYIITDPPGFRARRTKEIGTRQSPKKVQTDHLALSFSRHD